MTGFDLTGKTILLTGAAGGIGRATAKVLIQQGAQVILCDIAGPDGELLNALGDGARWEQCDVSNRNAVKTLATKYPDVDGLVLNAGILPFDDWMADDWDASFDKVMAVNVKGILNLARAFLPLMIARNSGSVVVVGSASGRMGGMQAGPHYVASKGAAHALVRWLALRAAAHGVVVNGIAPGSVDTEMLAGQPFTSNKVPVGRLARAEEIAWPIAFLCSPGASFMCGAVLDVNGGLVFS